jgi:phenylacetate-CoA ligase
MIIVRGVNVFPTQIEEQVCRHGRLSPHFQLVVTQRGHLDDLIVLVEPRPELAPFSENDRELVARELAHQIKAYVGVSPLVHVLDVGGVERSQGKAKRVVDQRHLV